MDGQFLIKYLARRARFRSKATLAGISGHLRCLKVPSLPAPRPNPAGLAEGSRWVIPGLQGGTTTGWQATIRLHPGGMPETCLARVRIRSKDVCEVVGAAARKAGFARKITARMLRHTFATHLVQEGVGPVTLRDLPGHQQITSTRICIHLTAQDLRQAAAPLSSGPAT